MAILLIDDHLGMIEAIPRYSGAAAGDLVGVDNAKVSAATDPVKGIIVDAVATDTPPAILKLAGRGCYVEDTVLDGVAPGTLIWSDGDGTYSSTQPTAAAGVKSVIFAIVRRIDTRAADTGCDLEIVNQIVEDGTA